MSPNTEPLTIVRRAYDCFSKHDIPGILQLIGADCDWRAPGPTPAMPWAGTYRGPDEVRKFFDKLDMNLEFLEFSPLDYLVEGDKVMVRGHERDRSKMTGKEFEVDWAHYFVVKDGKIVRFEDFQDTASIQAALLH
ncbi:MAG: nuclear transport factor 2 family protein [Rhodospirillaceae bacterium]